METDTNPAQRPDYEWMNEESRLFLERGYILTEETPQERIAQLAHAAGKRSNHKIT